MRERYRIAAHRASTSLNAILWALRIETSSACRKERARTLNLARSLSRVDWGKTSMVIGLSLRVSRSRCTIALLKRSSEEECGRVRPSELRCPSERKHGNQVMAQNGRAGYLILLP